MAKKSDSASRLLNSSSKIDGQSFSKLLAVTNLVKGPTNGASANSSGSLSPGAQSGLKNSSLTAKLLPTGIKFGKAPSSALTSSGTVGQWTKLLTQAASGNGLAGTFSGGLSGLGGIGSIVSGIMGLFGGGKKSLPALTAFQLPSSQEHTASIGNAITYSGNTVNIAASTGQTQSASSNFDSQWFMDNSNHIAQAVKSAMLNSNSLNDVVSEV